MKNNPQISQENTESLSEKIKNTKNSISFFSVIGGNIENIKNLDFVEKIFGDSGVIKRIFDIKHNFITDNNNLIVEGFDGINFVFKKNNIGNSLSILNLEIENIPNNLTRKQKHYLQSVFYNFRENGFSLKYIDDKFTNLTQKDFILGNKCTAGDVCTLIKSFKDSFKEDNKRIKELLEELKSGEKDNFEEIKREIISKEFHNILSFKLEIENIIFSRNEYLKQEQKNIDDLVLQEGLDNSVLIGNSFDSDKLEGLISLSTDKVLSGSFVILQNLIGKFSELISYLNQIEEIENEDKKIEYLENIIRTSNYLFVQAEKIAKKNGIFGLLLNPVQSVKNILSNKSKNSEEPKPLTKQQEIDEAMDVMVELLNFLKIYRTYEKGDKYLVEIMQKKFPNNKIIQNLYTGIGYFKITDLELIKIKEKISKDDFDLFDKISRDFPDFSKMSTFELSMMGSAPPANRLYYGYYNVLKNIFTKYEYFLKLLFFQDYAFEKSKYTENYQKVLYKKGEFYFDENVDFENFTKEFFEDLKNNFEEKELEKNNVWERLDYEIIEKNDNFTKDLSEFNNIFDIKIGKNIFPIYIINPIGDEKNKIVTIGTDIENEENILKDFLKLANVKNRENLQNGIKGIVKDILVMNFDEKDWNYKNKIDVANALLKANGRKENDFDVSGNFSRKFDLKNGIVKSEIILIDSTTKCYDYLGDKYKIYSNEFINNISVNFGIYLSEVSLGMYRNYLGGHILNNFIINHLVYGKKPDILETKINTYKKVYVGSKSYSNGKKRIIEEFDGNVVEERNFQYDEYLAFVDGYENEKIKKELEN